MTDQTDKTDIDALVAEVRGIADLLTGLANRATLRRAASALEATAQANEREAWGVANTRLDAYTDATRALSRAEETIAAIRAARSNHPECDAHGDADPVTCGWKRAVQDMDVALAAYEKGQQS